MNNFKQKGFSLLELIVVIALMLILFSIYTKTISNLHKEVLLEKSVANVLSALRLAKSNAVASNNKSPWGVYFNNTSSPHQITLFKGESFALRDVAFDETIVFSDGAVIKSINLAEGVQEIVFYRLSGDTDNFGNLSLALSANLAKEKIVYITSSGAIDVAFAAVSDTLRNKDSRHVHFIYQREIDPLSESLVLTFEGGVVDSALINDYLAGGIFDYSSDIEVTGEVQSIRIHSHRFNDSDTEFCVHRDIRNNSKALKIDITGDVLYPVLSPTLIEYTSDNLTNKGSSAFVSDPIWQ